MAGLVFISGFFVTAESAFQQTVQYLMFAIASIFLCTGFVITAIYQLLNKLNSSSFHSSSESDVLKNLHKAVTEESNASGFWKCKKCGCVNVDTAAQCKDCGEYK
jgi:hypothetical protein